LGKPTPPTQRDLSKTCTGLFIIAGSTTLPSNVSLDSPEFSKKFSELYSLFVDTKDYKDCVAASNNKKTQELLTWFCATEPYKTLPFCV
jgi:hypothetical protein